MQEPVDPAARKASKDAVPHTSRTPAKNYDPTAKFKSQGVAARTPSLFVSRDRDATARPTLRRRSDQVVAKKQPPVPPEDAHTLLETVGVQAAVVAAAPSACQMCNKSNGTLLWCDKCQQPWHAVCLKIPTPPVGRWECSVCERRPEEEQRRYARPAGVDEEVVSSALADDIMRMVDELVEVGSRQEVLVEMDDLDTSPQPLPSNVTQKAQQTDLVDELMGSLLVDEEGGEVVVEEEVGVVQPFRYMEEMIGGSEEIEVMRQEGEMVEEAFNREFVAHLFPAAQTMLLEASAGGGGGGGGRMVYAELNSDVMQEAGVGGEAGAVLESLVEKGRRMRGGEEVGGRGGGRVVKDLVSKLSLADQKQLETVVRETQPGEQVPLQIVMGEGEEQARLESARSCEGMAWEDDGWLPPPPSPHGMEEMDSMLLEVLSSLPVEHRQQVQDMVESMPPGDSTDISMSTFHECNAASPLLHMDTMLPAEEGDDVSKLLEMDVDSSQPPPTLPSPVIPAIPALARRQGSPAAEELLLRRVVQEMEVRAEVEPEQEMAKMLMSNWGMSQGEATEAMAAGMTQELRQLVQQGGAAARHALDMALLDVAEKWMAAKKAAAATKPSMEDGWNRFIQLLQHRGGFNEEEAITYISNGITPQLQLLLQQAVAAWTDKAFDSLLLAFIISGEQVESSLPPAPQQEEEEEEEEEAEVEETETVDEEDERTTDKGWQYLLEIVQNEVGGRIEDVEERLMVCVAVPQVRERFEQAVKDWQAGSFREVAAACIAGGVGAATEEEVKAWQKQRWMDRQIEEERARRKKIQRQATAKAKAEEKQAGAPKRRALTSSQRQTHLWQWKALQKQRFKEDKVGPLLPASRRRHKEVQQQQEQAGVPDKEEASSGGFQALLQRGMGPPPAELTEEQALATTVEGVYAPEMGGEEGKRRESLARGLAARRNWSVFNSLPVVAPPAAGAAGVAAAAAWGEEQQVYLEGEFYGRNIVRKRSPPKDGWRFVGEAPRALLPGETQLSYYGDPWRALGDRHDVKAMELTETQEKRRAAQVYQWVGADPIPRPSYAFYFPEEVKRRMPSAAQLYASIRGRVWTYVVTDLKPLWWHYDMHGLVAPWMYKAGTVYNHTHNYLWLMDSPEKRARRNLARRAMKARKQAEARMRAGVDAGVPVPEDNLEDLDLELDVELDRAFQQQEEEDMECPPEVMLAHPPPPPPPATSSHKRKGNDTTVLPVDDEDESGMDEDDGRAIPPPSAIASKEGHRAKRTKVMMVITPTAQEQLAFGRALALLPLPPLPLPLPPKFGVWVKVRRRASLRRIGEGLGEVRIRVLEERVARIVRLGERRGVHPSPSSLMGRSCSYTRRSHPLPVCTGTGTGSGREPDIQAVVATVMRNHVPVLRASGLVCAHLPQVCHYSPSASVREWPRLRTVGGGQGSLPVPADLKEEACAGEEGKEEGSCLVPAPVSVPAPEHLPAMGKAEALAFYKDVRRKALVKGRERNQAQWAAYHCRQRVQQEEEEEEEEVVAAEEEGEEEGGAAVMPVVPPAVEEEVADDPREWREAMSRRVLAVSEAKGWMRAGEYRLLDELRGKKKPCCSSGSRRREREGKYRRPLERWERGVEEREKVAQRRKWECLTEAREEVLEEYLMHLRATRKKGLAQALCRQYARRMEEVRELLERLTRRLLKARQLGKAAAHTLPMLAARDKLSAAQAALREAEDVVAAAVPHVDMSLVAEEENSQQDVSVRLVVDSEEVQVVLEQAPHIKVSLEEEEEEEVMVVTKEEEVVTAMREARKVEEVHNRLLFLMRAAQHARKEACRREESETCARLRRVLEREGGEKWRSAVAESREYDRVLAKLGAERRREKAGVVVEWLADCQRRETGITDAVHHIVRKHGKTVEEAKQWVVNFLRQPLPLPGLPVQEDDQVLEATPEEPSEVVVDDIPPPRPKNQYLGLVLQVCSREGGGCLASGIVVAPNMGITCMHRVMDEEGVVLPSGFKCTLGGSARIAEKLSLPHLDLTFFTIQGDGGSDSPAPLLGLAPTLPPDMRQLVGQEVLMVCHPGVVVKGVIAKILNHTTVLATYKCFFPASYGGAVFLASTGHLLGINTFTMHNQHVTAAFKSVALRSRDTFAQLPNHLAFVRKQAQLVQQAWPSLSSKYQVDYARKNLVYKGSCAAFVPWPLIKQHLDSLLETQRLNQLYSPPTIPPSN